MRRRGSEISETGSAALARLVASPLAASLALLLICAAAFLPGFAGLPPMDRDEPRFAQASKQMLETGDVVRIRFQDEARLKKPVGIYWLQAAAVAAGEGLGVPEARTTIWLYRLPSLLGAMAAVLLTRWAALPLVGPRAGFWAAAMMAAAILPGVEARLATTDAVLLATTVAMLGALARLAPMGDRVVPSFRLAVPAVFWSAAAVSVLIKGPIGPMVALLTVAALWLWTRQAGWLRRLRPLPGIVWLLLLVAPWFVAIMIATKGRFLYDSVGQDMVAKVAGAKESHGAPPGTYLAAFWLTFWPAAPLAALGAPWTWRHRAEPAVRFLLCWLLPSWVVFEAVPTKLPHYVLPLYPAIAMLVAAAVEGGALSRRPWARAVAALIPLLALATPVGAAVAVWIYQHAVAWPLLVAAPVCCALGLAAWWALPARPERGLGLALATGLLVAGSVYSFGMPEVPALWPSPRLAAAGQALDCADPRYASVDYHEPSLVFLLGTGLALPDHGAEAADFLAPGGCRMAFVPLGEEAAFHRRLAERGAEAALVTRVQGINLNGGHRLDIGAWRPVPPAGGATTP